MTDRKFYKYWVYFYRNMQIKKLIKEELTYHESVLLELGLSIKPKILKERLDVVNKLLSYYVNGEI